MAALMDKGYQRMAMLIAAAMIVHIVQSCGIPEIRPFKIPPKASRNRIVNGWEAKPHSLPWMVFVLLTYRNGFVTCSGFLIENGMTNQTDILLTATHCLHIRGKYQPPGNIYFLVGAHNVDSLEDSVQRRARNYVTHFYTPLSEDNDIAMVRLDKPVTFSSHISPLCLPDGEMPKVENGECFAAGWGKTERNISSATLKMTPLTILPDYFCESFVQIRRQFCVGQYFREYSTCHGDSGSPLFCEIDGRFVALGVLSVGALNCTENVPAIYTRLSAYGYWINSSLAKLQRAPDQTGYTEEQGTIYIPKRTRLPGMLSSGSQHELIHGSSLIALLSGYHRRPTA
ncbi:trypsin [Trichuris suis]|nr:trypsin [Trichuris suis]